MNEAEKSNNYRPKSHGFAFSRTVSCRFLCGPLRTSVFSASKTPFNAEGAELAADGDAQSADVAAGVKSAERDGVLARSK